MTRPTSPEDRPLTSRSFDVLICLAVLAIFLQAVWAGVFLSYDRRPVGWIDVHARGGEVAIVLVFLALVAAWFTRRTRVDLLIGTGVLLGLLVVEAYLGGRITNGHHLVTMVHVPLGMGIMALAIWLPMRLRTTASR